MLLASSSAWEIQEIPISFLLAYLPWFTYIYPPKYLEGTTCREIWDFESEILQGTRRAA